MLVTQGNNFWSFNDSYFTTFSNCLKLLNALFLVSCVQVCFCFTWSWTTNNWENHKCCYVISCWSWGLCCWYCVQKGLSCGNKLSLASDLSPLRFRDCGHMRSLIHLELSLVQGDNIRICFHSSMCSYLLWWAPVFNKAVFPQVCVFGLSKSTVHNVEMWNCGWLLNYIPLITMLVFIPIHTGFLLL